MQDDVHWRRLHIIGGAGSGKTTLAEALALRLGIPSHDLDEVAYQGEFHGRRSRDERVAAVREIAAQPAWITEGIYLWWIDDLLQAADVIIWLDIPWRVAAWRIVKRHVIKTITHTNRFPGTRQLLRFLRSTWRYDHQRSAVIPADLTDDSACTRVATVAYLAPYQDKLLRNPRFPHLAHRTHHNSPS